MQELQETWVQWLGWGYPLEEEMANPLQGSCQKTPMDRGVWRITVHRVTKSGTRLSNWTHTHIICLSIHSLSGHLNCFPLLVIMNSPAINRCICVLVWVPVSVLWAVFLGVGLVGHMVVLCLTFKEKPNFSTATESFSFPSPMCEDSSFSTS